MKMSLRRHLKQAFYGNLTLDLPARLAEARAAVVEGIHEEALHDWRVLARRLIEYTRIWAPSSIRRPILDLTRPWIRATNAARDHEVEQALFRQLMESDPDHPARAAWDSLRKNHARAATKARTAARRFLAEPARAEEERQLALLLADLPAFAARPPCLPRRLCRRVGEIAAALDKKGFNLRSIHPVRLAAKQVRYGLEPLARMNKRLGAALEEVKALQRSLGECRDWRRLAQTLTEAGALERLVRQARRRGRKAFDSAPRDLREARRLTRRRFAALRKSVGGRAGGSAGGS